MKEIIKNKKTLLITVLVLLVLVIGLTFAYFVGQIGSGATANVTLTTATVDTLTFSTGADITIGPVTQQNFASGAGNKSGSTTASAMLRANNTTNTASETYNLYLNITNNTFHKTTSSAELILTITNPNGTTVNSISGLTYTTVGGVSGFDVTEKSGLITIANNYTISVPNQANNPKTDTWNITLTFVNLDADQTANAGASFQAQAIIQKESFYFNGTIYRYSEVTLFNGQNIHGGNLQGYCITGNDYNSCDYDNFYSNQTKCQNILDGELTGNYSCTPGYITTSPIGEYTTDSSTINNSFYLKHVVVDNVIQSTSSCFRKNNTEYCLIGGDGGTAYSTNVSTLSTAFDYPNNQNSCGDDETYFQCNDENLYALAQSDGEVGIDRGDGVDCNVFAYEYSRCDLNNGPHTY